MVLIGRNRESLLGRSMDAADMNLVMTFLKNDPVRNQVSKKYREIGFKILEQKEMKVEKEEEHIEKKIEKKSKTKQ